MHKITADLYVASEARISVRLEINNETKGLTCICGSERTPLALAIFYGVCHKLELPRNYKGRITISFSIPYDNWCNIKKIQIKRSGLNGYQETIFRVHRDAVSSAFKHNRVTGTSVTEILEMLGHFIPYCHREFNTYSLLHSKT